MRKNFVISLFVAIVGVGVISIIAFDGFGVNFFTLSQNDNKAVDQSLNILTRSYDNTRLGLNSNETILTTSNVNPKSFGKLFTRQVDGQIYAQPLYLSNFSIPSKGTHNIVIIATQHNSVYAFDADDPAASSPLWQVNLGPSAPTPNPDFGNYYGTYQDIVPEVGITSTPVIDLETKTLFVVALVKDKSKGSYRHELHALDLLTGQDKAGSPKVIAASVSGKGSDNNIDNDPTRVTFDSKQHLQRTSLLLSKQRIFIAFAGYGDTPPYHGWVMAYDASSLEQIAALNITPDGGPSSEEEGNGKGGIWMSGEGISVDDSGDLYLVTGDGTFSAGEGGRDYGNSVLRLRLEGNSFIIKSYFTPFNYQTLSRNDKDLGSGGVLLLPVVNRQGQKLALIGSKEGKLYVLNRENMGGVCGGCSNPSAGGVGGDTNVEQWLQGSNGSLVGGSPVYWNSSKLGPLVYIWGEKDYLKAFSFNQDSGRFNLAPVSQSTMTVPQLMPGGVLSVSANGSKEGTGIVWAIHPLCTDLRAATRPGIIRAFNATNLTEELWNSEMVKGAGEVNLPCNTVKPIYNARDGLGIQAKFNPPIVANGKVYVGTFSKELVVYGLLATTAGPGK